MAWTNAEVFELINLYRERPILWNFHLKDYKNKKKKKAAVLEIVNSLNVSKKEVERKIRNLLSHFSREVKRERDSIKSGANCNRVYKSKWFCYKNMLFLKDRKHPEGITNTTQDENTTKNEDTIHETHNVEQNQLARKDIYESGESSKSPSAPAGSQKKRKILDTEESICIGGDIQRCNALVTDQYRSFGDQVGLRIRDLPSSKAQNITKYLISHILFEAEMGKYDNCNPVHATYPQYFQPILNDIHQQVSVPMAPVITNSIQQFEQQFVKLESPQPLLSPTPSAHFSMDSDSIDDILREI